MIPKTWSKILVILLVILLLAPTTVFAAAQGQGSPTISVFLPDDRVSPGEETTLSLVILNGGEVTSGSSSAAQSRATTARDVTLKLTSNDAPIQVLTGTLPIGNVAEGTSSPVLIDISVDSNAVPGTYDLTVTVDYKWTTIIGPPDSPGHGEDTKTVTQKVSLIVEPVPLFNVDKISLGPIFDGYGDLNIDIKNYGSDIAYDSIFTITSQSSELKFGNSDNPSTSSSAFIGNMDAGSSYSVPLEVQFKKGSVGRSHPVSISLSYSDKFGESKTSETITSGISPTSDNGRFSISEVSNDISLGQEGIIHLTLTNDAPDAITNSRVSVTSTDTKLSFGGSNAAEYVIGPWSQSSSKDISFKASLSESSNVRPYPLILTIHYKTSDNSDRASDPITIGITPLGEQTFNIKDARSNLSVGSEGELVGKILNNGPQSVENAVIIFQSDLNTISAIEEEYAIGTLSPGDSESFKFSLDISESATEGKRQVSLTIRYRDSDGKSHLSEPLDVILDISNKKDAFEISPINSVFVPGSGSLLTLQVTNTGTETISDISAKIFPESPISAKDDTAFISELLPGENKQIIFDISISNSALVKVYPLDLDFQYDTSSGDTLLSDTYQIPIDVTLETRRGGSSSIPIVPILVAIIAATIGALYIRRNRQNK